MFGVSTLEKAAHDDFRKLASAIYLQVSTISQALIFVTRSRGWSYVERPGLLLVAAFVVAQLVSYLIIYSIAVIFHCIKFGDGFCCVQIATLIAVYANWSFAAIEGIGWGWAGVIWLYNIIFYIPLDFIKFFTRYVLSGRAWDLVIEQRVSSVCFVELINPRMALIFALCLWILLSCRLHSQGKRTLERSKGNFNGHMRKEHCMDYSHLTPRCSLSAHMSTNSIKWPKKLKGELKLRGRLKSSLNGFV